MTTPVFTFKLIALVGAASILSVAIAQGPDPDIAPEENPWERSASAGLTLTRGNSETLMFTADVLALRKVSPNEISLGADMTYGETEGDKTAESIHGFAQYNRLFSERLYGYARLDALHDSIADVDYRFTLGPGAGYYFIKSERTELSAEAGPSFVYEKQGDEEQGYLALRLGEKFEHKLNDRARIWQSLEFLPQVDDFENFIVKAEVGVEAAFTEKLSLRVTVSDIYDNDPAEGREENDLKLVSGIAYKF